MHRRVLAAVCALLLVAAGLAVRSSYLPADDEASRSASSHDTKEKLNLRPLVGILAQPGPPAPRGHTFIPASVSKWVEAGGAQAVPIQCDLPEDELRHRFSVVNGVVLPGGAEALKPGYCYFDATRKLLNMTLEANKEGDYFPMHATCLGFESILTAISGDEDILTKADALNYPAPLEWNEPEAKESHYFLGLPKYLRKRMQRKPYAMHNNQWGVSKRDWDECDKLSSFFNLVSTTKDRQGQEYVTTIEAKEHPILGTQWHPEKNAFEWVRKQKIPKEPDAIDVSLATAKMFINNTRRNFHAPASAQEEEELQIYNWPPVHTKQLETGKGESMFTAVHVFPPVDKRRPPKYQNERRRSYADDEFLLAEMVGSMK